MDQSQHFRQLLLRTMQSDRCRTAVIADIVDGYASDGQKIPLYRAGCIADRLMNLAEYHLARVEAIAMANGHEQRWRKCTATFCCHCGRAFCPYRRAFHVFTIME